MGERKDFYVKRALDDARKEKAYYILHSPTVNFSFYYRVYKLKLD